MFMAMSSWQVHLINVEQCQPVCESASWLLSPSSSFIITQTKSWYLFYCSFNNFSHSSTCTPDELICECEQSYLYSPAACIVISGICDSVCVCVFFCTTKPKWPTWHSDSPSQYLAHRLILGWMVKDPGCSWKVQKGDRVVGVSYARRRVTRCIYCKCNMFSLSTV